MMGRFFLNKGVRMIFWIIALLGVIGTVAFFPINIANRYTCLYHLYHRMVYAESAVQHTDSHMSDANRHHLHEQYMSSFRFMWWGSLVLLLVGIAGIRSSHQPTTMRETPSDINRTTITHHQLTGEIEE
jgi:hypothetical protein